MPVAVNKKPKGATSVKKKTPTKKTTKAAKNATGAKATKKKATQEPKKSCAPVAKSKEPVEATRNVKKNGKILESPPKKPEKSSATTSATKNMDLEKQKPISKTKIHPEVAKLVNMLKSSIRDLSRNGTHHSLTKIKEEKRDEINYNLKKIKREKCEETDVEISCGPWGLEYESSSTYDNDTDTDSVSCSDSECSCCTDSYESIDADYSSSCSDDDENEETCSECDDTSSCDEDFTDEYTPNDYDADSDDESCSGCDKCMPSTTHDKKTLMSPSTRDKRAHVPKPKSKQRPIKKSSGNQKNCGEKLTKVKPKQSVPVKKVIKNKKSVVKSKIATASFTPTTTKGADLKKTVPKKKTAYVTQATTQPKKTTTSTNAAPSKKIKPLTEITNAAASKKIKPLTEITNAASNKATSTKAVSTNPKVLIKKPSHVLQPTNASNLKTEMPSTSASTSSGYSSAVLKSSKCNTTRSALSSNVTSRTHRSIGVSCHLPDANSTFQNNCSGKLWRF